MDAQNDLGQHASGQNVTANSYFMSKGGENKKKKTPWSESVSELYRPSDRRLSAK
jgi:hypothetical protein